MAKYLASRLGLPPHASGIPPPSSSGCPRHSVASLGSRLRYFGICPPFPHNIVSFFTIFLFIARAPLSDLAEILGGGMAMCNSNFSDIQLCGTEVWTNKREILLAISRSKHKIYLFQLSPSLNNKVVKPHNELVAEYCLECTVECPFLCMQEKGCSAYGLLLSVKIYFLEIRFVNSKRSNLTAPGSDTMVSFPFGIHCQVPFPRHAAKGKCCM